MTSFARRLLQRLGVAPPPPKAGEVIWINPAPLKMGPIKHEVLTPDQRQRIERLHDRLHPIDGWSLEKRIGLFQRDTHLDRELAICETIADVCDEAFATLGPLTPEQRDEIYGLANLASGAPPDDVLAHYTPRALSLDQAKQVLRLFS